MPRPHLPDDDSKAGPVSYRMNRRSSRSSQTTSDLDFLTLLQPDSEYTQSQLEFHRKDLAEQFQKTIRAAARFEKRLQGGEYGDINGIGIELHHKRGMIAVPIQYGLTVFVPRKFPMSQLRKRRRAREQTGGPRSNSTVSSQPVKIPSVFEKIPVKVQEANAVPAIAQEAIYTDATTFDWVKPFSSLQDMFRGGLPIGGSPISNTPFPLSAVDKSPSNENAATIEWGTLGITCSTVQGTKIGFSCAHVVDSGDVYAPVLTEDSSKISMSIGTVTQASHLPRKGVDASLIQLHREHAEGVLGLEDSFHKLRFLAKAPSRKSIWSWLIQCKVQLRGARTGRTVEGLISMPTVHSIVIAGKKFEDLMIVQSRSGSAAIVAPGDSGAAVVACWNGHWYWIGIVVAMISPQQAVVSKLPACLAACSLKPSDFPQDRLWTLEGNW